MLYKGQVERTRLRSQETKRTDTANLEKKVKRVLRSEYKLQDEELSKGGENPLFYSREKGSNPTREEKEI